MVQEHQERILKTVNVMNIKKTDDICSDLSKCAQRAALCVKWVGGGRNVLMGVDNLY